MRKFERNNTSKQGVVLVIVLFILAMAMIFISAALMLTNATRGRLYENATGSQARLTVTSAAEAFARAVEIQEFSDDELDTMIGNFNSKSKALVLTSTNAVPGMGNAAGGYDSANDRPTDNTTILWFTTATVSGKDYVYANFSTNIDGDVENVRVVMSAKEPDPELNLFNNVLDLTGNESDVSNLNIGKGAPAGADDNMVIVRGGYASDNQGQSDSYSTFVFVGTDSAHPTRIELRDSNYYGDLIFFGDYSTLVWTKQPKIKGNVYFLGNNGGTDYDAFSGTFGESKDLGNSTWTFVNRLVNNESTVVNMLDKGHVVSLDGNAGSLTWSDNNLEGISKAADWKSAYSSNISTTTGWAARARTDAKDYMKIDVSSAAGKAPTTTEAFKAAGIKINSADVTGIQNYSASSFMTAYGHSVSDATSADSLYLPAGDYALTDGAGKTYMNTNNKDSVNGLRFVFLNGAYDYNIYFNSTYDITGVTFVTIGSGTGKANFIIAKDKDLAMTKCNYGENNKYCTGFVSVSSKNYTSPQAFLSAQSGTGASLNSVNATYYDGKNKPKIYVYGVGSNLVDIDRTTVQECYIGLYDSSYTSSSSKIEFHEGSSSDKWHFYGRIQAPKVITHTGGNVDVFYSPDPNAKEDPSGQVVNSKYSVVDFIYYYDVA